MGCTQSKDKHVEDDDSYELNPGGRLAAAAVPHGTTAYLAMAMQQAGSMGYALAYHYPAPDDDDAMAPGPLLNEQATVRLIRRAKAEGCTVTVIDDSLYIDYKFIGHLPPDADIRI